LLKVGIGQNYLPTQRETTTLTVRQPLSHKKRQGPGEFPLKCQSPAPPTPEDRRTRAYSSVVHNVGFAALRWIPSNARAPLPPGSRNRLYAIGMGRFLREFARLHPHVRILWYAVVFLAITVAATAFVR
jgi:hypothetical protein